ncbi:MAG: hypothetical protein AB1726_16080 [Planctomycetota bacterium]
MVRHVSRPGRLVRLVRLLLSLPLFLASLASAQVATEDSVYAIEINGVTCGYADVHVAPLAQGGRELMLLEERMFLMLSALGNEFNANVTFTYHIDPATGQYVSHTNVFELQAGEVQKTAYTKVGRETIELAGRTFAAVVLDEQNQSTGVRARTWLDVTDGRFLFLASLNAEFTVLWRDGRLAIEDPLEKKIVHFRPGEAEGVWIDEFAKNSLSFRKNDAGAVLVLVLDVANRFPKR